MSTEDEWTLADDGLLERTAARIVLFDPQGRIFLIKGHDSEDTSHAWWFTVGGGLDRDEEPRAGALRELFEETGLEVTADRLIGPVMERSAIFRFAFHNRRQYEKFYLLHVTAEEADLVSAWDQNNLTALELDVLDEVAWWDLGDLGKAQSNGVKIFPVALADLARKWWAGWDGSVDTIDEP